MTTIESKSIYELPEYLGLGILNHNSIVRTEKGVSATYTLGLDVVYAVEWTQTGCKLEEFYQGDTIASAYGENLNLAFFNLLKASNPIEHPRFIQLYNSVNSAGNIYFIYPNMKIAFLYYPAGFIFSLRQPIVDCNYDAWVRLQNDVKRNDPVFPLKIDTRLGAIFRLMKDGTVSKEDTTIIQLGCSLRDLAKSVEFCQQNGLIPSEKEYRMTIHSGGSTPHSLKLFTGDLQRSIQAFALFEFGTQSGQISADRADQLFANLCNANRS